MLYREERQAHNKTHAATPAQAGVLSPDNAGYQLDISDDVRDAAWDAFVAGVPGGHYVQSARWSELKAVNSWRVARITATQHGEIAAGVQLLLRPISLLGSVGYVPRGPLMTSGDPKVVELLMHKLLALAKDRRCQMLIVQPPHDTAALSAQLADRHFRPTTRKVAPTYSVLLDLRPSESEILANMKRQTRYNVRLGMRKGLTARIGSDEDLPAYYDLLAMTSDRQGFDISSRRYYERMWQIFHPSGSLQLFLMEYEGELVSAQLALGFGDTVVNKMSAWSGRHGNLKPNEALMWAAVKWARQNGYAHYDFGGMSSKVATTILRGDPLTERMKRSVSSFKLGFGGDVVSFPQAYLHVRNPLLRWGQGALRPTLEKSTTVKRIMHRFRTR